MKTFNDIQESVRANIISTMSDSSRKLQGESFNQANGAVAQMVVETCQGELANIDEVTTIEIGSLTNSLIGAVKKGYEFHSAEYWRDFEGFCDKYIVGLTADGGLKEGQFLGQAQCAILGIGVHDLSCLKGSNPGSEDFGDSLRQEINQSMGTNIPMASDVRQAQEDYVSVCYGQDDVAKAQAFTHLKEVKRDAGEARNGGIYYPLATDRDYQAAKAMVSGRTR
jgi:hypothetical protein